MNLRIAKTTITKRKYFYHSDAEGIYAWVGMELMAQTAAVFASHQGKAICQQWVFIKLLENFQAIVLFFKLG